MRALFAGLLLMAALATASSGSAGPIPTWIAPDTAPSIVGGPWPEPFIGQFPLTRR